MQLPDRSISRTAQNLLYAVIFQTSKSYEMAGRQSNISRFLDVVQIQLDSVQYVSFGLYQL